MIKIDFTNPFVLVFTIGTIVSFLINHFLEFIDLKSRQKNGGKIPEILKSIPNAAEQFDEAKLKKIVAYENAKYYFWIPFSICSVLLTLSLIFFGFYPWCFELTAKITGIPHNFWTLFCCYLIFSIITEIPETILSIPFSLYREFSIEKRFGFSNMTLKLWISDQIKSLIIGIIPSLLLSAAISFAFTFFVNTWWIIVSIVLVIFIVLIQIIYPKFIAPIFNKFEPLPDGELKTKLSALIEKIGFKNGGLFIMDASKRSGHSNAYFSGFGKSKRIVLYDTLTNQLTPDELVSVLGHELGHFKLKHITKRFIFMFPLIFIATFVLFKMSQLSEMYTAFGFNISDIDIRWIQFIGLTLTGFIWNSISEILTPIGNISSRRHEYQADRFASENCNGPDALISGLIKLNSENLSELFPPAIYVWWIFSHPTLVQRIEALKKGK